MERITKYSHHYLSWQTLVLFFAILLVGLPSVFVNWMIIDDGVNIARSESLINLIKNLDLTGLAEFFFEKEAGRFRPAYWLYQWGVYLVAGKNAFLHHLISFILNASTVILIYLTIRELTSSKTAGLVSCLLFLLAPFNIENWYRLGPQEPRVGFYLAVLVFSLVKILHPLLVSKKKFLFQKRYLVASIVCLFLAFLTKETFLAILPFFVFLWAGVYLLKGRERKSQWIKTVMLCLSLGIVMSLVLLSGSQFVRQEGTYSFSYNFSLEDFWNNGRWYLLAVLAKTFQPLSWILFGSFIYYFIFKRNKQKRPASRFFQLAFLFAFFSFLIIQLPWPIPMGRYLEPAFVFFILALGIEIASLLRLRHHKIQFLLFSVYFVFLMMTAGFTIFNYIRDTIVGQANIARILITLASIAPQDSKIFWNLKKDESTVELVQEVNIHVHSFYKRPDLTVLYLGNLEAGKFKKGDLVMTAVDSRDLILFQEEELAMDKRLSIVKVIPHTIIRYVFHPLSSMKYIGHELFGLPRPVHDPFETTVIRSNWIIYQVSS